MQVGKQLKKIPVMVKVCFGFAGNRMYTRYGREIQQMLLEGATVAQIDEAMTGWGMAMGPLAVFDLAGLDVGYKARQGLPEDKRGDPRAFRVADALVEMGRCRENGYCCGGGGGGMWLDSFSQDHTSMRELALKGFALGD